MIVQSPERQEHGDFRCPKCGSRTFGSSTGPDGVFRWHCTGNEEHRCSYKAVEADAAACFVSPHKEALDRRDAQWRKAILAAGGFVRL